MYSRGLFSMSRLGNQPPTFAFLMRPYPLPHRLLSLTLALLVLVASVGLPVQRRTCRLSGRRTVHLGWYTLNGTARGTTKAPTARLAGSCYAYSFQLHQLPTGSPTTATAKLLPAGPGLLALLPVGQLRFASGPRWAATAPTSRGPGEPAPPPRPGGRRLLVRIGLLLV